MFRAASVVAALGLVVAVAGPASAQDRGGVRMRDPGALLDQVQSRQPGCPLSQTNVTVGVNRVLSGAMQSQQQISSQVGGCRPLVSTQIAAGFNLAMSPGSAATQTIDSQGPRGLLSTHTYTRGVNVAGGAGSYAGQRILNQTGR